MKNECFSSVCERGVRMCVLAYGEPGRMGFGCGLLKLAKLAAGVVYITNVSLYFRQERTIFTARGAEGKCMRASGVKGQPTICSTTVDRSAAAAVAVAVVADVADVAAAVGAAHTYSWG